MKDIANTSPNKVIKIVVNGQDTGISLQLDDSQTGVVIRAGDKTYRHLIPQNRSER